MGKQASIPVMKAGKVKQGSAAPSRSAKKGPSRREIIAHGLEPLAESTIPPARREILTHGSKALVNTKDAEPERLFCPAAVAHSGNKHNDNCCGIMSLVNVLDNEEQRRAFCGGNLEQPEAAFLEFMKRKEPNYDGGQHGYTHIQFQNYMKELEELGKIKSFVFRRLKKYSIEDLLGPRGLDKRLKAEQGDNLVVFGRARKSDHAKSTLASMRNEVRKGKDKGLSQEQLNFIALQVYCRSSSSHCNSSNPTHAIGIRLRPGEGEQGSKPVAHIVDPAKEVAKPLDPFNYADSMAERKEGSEAGKQQYEAHYYVFRVEF